MKLLINFIKKNRGSILDVLFTFPKIWKLGNYIPTSYWFGKKNLGDKNSLKFSTNFFWNWFFFEVIEQLQNKKLRMSFIHIDTFSTSIEVAQLQANYLLKSVLFLNFEILAQFSCFCKNCFSEWPRSDAEVDQLLIMGKILSNVLFIAPIFLKWIKQGYL